MNGKPRTQLNSITVVIVIFLIWTLISTIFTIGIPSLVWPEWIEFLKIITLYVLGTLTIRTTNQVNTVIWAIALSVGAYSFIEGLKYISSGGGHILEGMPTHILGDRNDLAVAINMTIPLIIYLSKITTNKWVKIGLYAMIVLCAISVLGSGSRGGFIGMFVILAYFWFFSKRKILYAVLAPLVFYSALSVMPEQWHKRMDTIESASTDSSFLGRVLAWKQAVLIASDNVTGAGFKVGQMNVIWKIYDPHHEFSWIIDTSSIHVDLAKAAHSIYFQVLGDHGFIGLFLFMNICFLSIVKIRAVNINLKNYDSQHEFSKLSSMVYLSLVAYFVSGAAVSLAYFDLFYILLALVVVLNNHSENLRDNKRPLA